MFILKGKTNVRYLFVLAIVTIFAGGIIIGAAKIINYPYFFPSFMGNNSAEVVLGKEFTIDFGQTIEIKSENLKIQFLNVLDDSRCPSDVQCIWAGQAKVVLDIHKDDQKNLGNYEFVVSAGDSPVQNREGYSVKLVRLEPYPVSTKTIEKSEYKINLIVSKKMIDCSCQTVADCVHVGCGCKCSGCGGFDYEEIINKNSKEEWYGQHNCPESTICPQVCCGPVTIFCENNICLAR
jgi:hypothetical protein